jgi:G3E family GTPase
MIPVTVISGYLGAGKTTLINMLLRQAEGTRIAIMVNDFGDLPIDADLIEARDDDVIALTGGCVCCAFGNDLAGSLLQMRQLAQTPDHILIEASGVALPGAIAATVSLVAGCQMAATCVLVDVETVRDQAKDPYIGDTILRQLNDADIVLRTKSDLVAPEDHQVVQNWLSDIAPQAAQVEATLGAVPPGVILGPRPPRDLPAQRAPHETPYSTFVIDLPDPIDGQKLCAALADPSLGLLRAKGFLRTPSGDICLLQAVGPRCTLCPATRVEPPALVFIGHAELLQEKKIRSLVQSLVLNKVSGFCSMPPKT